MIALNFNWAHAGPPLVAAFLASLVEFVEALTVILAVGSVRGWRGAIGGAVTALAVLLGVILVLGGTLTRLPLGVLQMIVGPLLLLFGLRWLRKAILRSAGVIPLHDEAAAFAKETDALRRLGASSGWDRVGFAASFQITMLEGMEVVFIVIAVAAGGPGLLLPASIGALAALLLVVLLGLAVHKPLARVPENTLKFLVGILLSAFGTFWLGEGIGLDWPGGDWAVLALTAGYILAAALTVPLCRSLALSRTRLTAR
jgi:Ca2+/H+ antiporter, TMEM165/GDT1 family